MVTKKPSSPIPPYIANVCALVTEKLRWRNSSSGSIGILVWASCQMKVARNTTPATRAPHTPGRDHPSTGCSISPNEIPARPSAANAAPIQSMRIVGHPLSPAGHGHA